ncbi:MAG: hypothetical protein ABI895_14960 [Deltaproteobacteria bacterium]
MLALATWRALSQHFPGAAVAYVGASLLFVLPPLMHVAYGRAKRAWLALVSMLAYTALGSAGGAALGRTLAHLSCDSVSECGLTLLAGLLLGAVVGGVVGYLVHAVRQVLLATQSGHPSPTNVETTPSEHPSSATLTSSRA